MERPYLDRVCELVSSPSAGKYEPQLRDHGWQVVLYRCEDPDCGGHTMWLARRTDTIAAGGAR